MDFERHLLRPEKTPRIHEPYVKKRNTVNGVSNMRRRTLKATCVCCRLNRIEVKSIEIGRRDSLPAP